MMGITPMSALRQKVAFERRICLDCWRMGVESSEQEKR